MTEPSEEEAQKLRCGRLGRRVRARRAGGWRRSASWRRPRHAQAGEERLLACKAERDELEAGILHARDVCAQKDVDAEAMADQHTAELEEAVARGTPRRPPRRGSARRCRPP